MREIKLKSTSEVTLADYISGVSGPVNCLTHSFGTFRSLTFRETKMSEVKVCEGLELININGHELETIRDSNNTFDFGAISILEGLQFLIEDGLLAEYDYEDDIPYDRLFDSLKQLIISACDNEDVRAGILTGALKLGTQSFSASSSKKIQTKRSCRKPVQRNLSAISLYAKTHNISEITEKYDFVNTKQCSNYLRHHGVEWVRNSKGGKVTQLYSSTEQIRKIAPGMRLYELASIYGVKNGTMLCFLRANNINYKKVDKHGNPLC